MDIIGAAPGWIGDRILRSHRAGRAVAYACSRALLSVGVVLAGMAGIGELDRRALGASAANPGPPPVCRPITDAAITDYLTGEACPPQGFVPVIGYRPILRVGPDGWRYGKPTSAGGRCSGPVSNTGPFWEFTLACQTHDYGYDLVRFGVGGRGEADRLLYRDMLASCEREAGLDGVSCRAFAATSWSILRTGEAMAGGPHPGSSRVASEEEGT